MIITCIRHLKSAANQRRGFCYKNDTERRDLDLPSDNDVPLISEGIRHGRRLQKKFASMKLFDPEEMDFYISPYLRTVQTAEIIFPQHKNRFVVDTRCARNNGCCAHMTRAEVELHFSWLKKYWSKTHPLLATPPGGECMLDVVHRVRPFIAETIASGRNRCIIGHGNLFKAIDFILQEMTFPDFPKIPNAPNGSLTVYRNVHLGKRGMTIDRYHELLCK